MIHNPQWYRPLDIESKIPDGVGLPGRRFPFLAETPEEVEKVRVDVDRVLRGIEPMIYSMVAHAQRRARISDEDAQDLAIKIMTSLWQKSLPRYDCERVSPKTNRRAKLSTFLYVCVRQMVCQELRSSGRRSRRSNIPKFVSIEMAADTGTEFDDHAYDEKIEQIARDVHENPEKYMTQHQAEVFRATMGRDGKLMKDMAADMGYKGAASLSGIMARIRERISKINVRE